ncbi:hypothetical protein HDU96_005374, partial [Phlyctochytrium bullatum]
MSSPPPTTTTQPRAPDSPEMDTAAGMLDNYRRQRPPATNGNLYGNEDDDDCWPGVDFAKFWRVWLCTKALAILTVIGFTIYAIKRDEKDGRQSLASFPSHHGVDDRALERVTNMTYTGEMDLTRSMRGSFLVFDANLNGPPRRMRMISTNSISEVKSGKLDTRGDSVGLHAVDSVQRENTTDVALSAEPATSSDADVIRHADLFAAFSNVADLLSQGKKKEDKPQKADEKKQKLRSRHCIICLEPWAVGSNISVLACGHAYHAESVSWIISVPLAFYKWDLAVKEEEREARRAFMETASNLGDTIKTNWQYAINGAIIMSSYYISHGPGNEFPYEAFSNFTNSKEFFTFLTKSIVLGVYRNVPPSERRVWETRMLQAPACSADRIKKSARVNGVVTVDNFSPALYPVILISDIANPLNRAALGSNSYADTLERRPLIEYMQRTGDNGTTGRVWLTRSAAPSAGILTMVPIFRDTSTSSRQLTRNLTSEIVAVAFSSVECQDVFNTAFGSNRIAFPENYDVFLFDVDGRVNNTFLSHFSKVSHELYDNFTLSQNISEADVRRNPYDLWYSEDISTAN